MLLSAVFTSAIADSFEPPVLLASKDTEAVPVTVNCNAPDAFEPSSIAFNALASVELFVLNVAVPSDFT